VTDPEEVTCSTTRRIKVHGRQRKNIDEQTLIHVLLLIADELATAEHAEPPDGEARSPPHRRHRRPPG
jgi:hypothetical protein